MKFILYLSIALLVSLLSVIAGAKNDQMVTLNYFIAQSDLRLSSVMAIMLFVGMLFSSLIFLVIWLKMRFRIGQLKRKQ